jgi:hypothetical protein
MDRTMLFKVTRELGFCLIYKNASSSMRAARPMRPVTRAEFLSLDRRVALLREPHDRFGSTWRDYRSTTRCPPQGVEGSIAPTAGHECDRLQPCVRFAPPVGPLRSPIEGSAKGSSPVERTQR